MANDANNRRSPRRGAHSMTARQELVAAMSEIRTGCGKPTLDEIADETVQLDVETKHSYDPYTSVGRNTVQKIFSTTGRTPRWPAFRSVLCALKVDPESSPIRALWGAARQEEEEPGDATQEIDMFSATSPNAPAVAESTEALRNDMASAAERILQRALGPLLSDEGNPADDVAVVGRLLLDAQILQGRWPEAAETVREMFVVLGSFARFPGLAVRHWLLTSGSFLTPEAVERAAPIIQRALEGRRSNDPADVIARIVRDNLVIFAGQDRPRPVRRHERSGIPHRPPPAAEVELLLQIQAATAVLGASDPRTLALRLSFCRLLMYTSGIGDDRFVRERRRLTFDLSATDHEASGAVLALRYQVSQLVDPHEVDAASLDEMDNLLYAGPGLAPAHKISADFVATLTTYAEAQLHRYGPERAASAIADLEQLAMTLQKATDEATESAERLRSEIDGPVSRPSR